MKYHEAIDYLQNLTRFGINLGLDRINELLCRLGNPHLHLHVIHIGGTNGKGSTVAMVASILKAAGYKVGTFTSPHLHSYTERYQINGKEISPERMARLISCLRPHLDGMVAEGFEHPTEFEVSTAMAFKYFLEENVDFLVLEVGLGGVIDSTNVVHPLVAVITNVAVDHMDYLGSTIEEIATVKAGIIKSGVPVAITAANEPKALDVICRICQEKQVPLVRVGQKTGLSTRQVIYFKQDKDFSLDGQYLTVKGLSCSYENLFLPLLGRHQLVNAATALATIEALCEQGYKVSLEAIYKGLASTRWPARLEIISRKPLIILDGAHNYDGARSLRRALDDYFPQRGIIMVLGMLGDKERAKVIKELVQKARAVVVTKPDSPRALNWRYIADEARRYAGKVYAIECIKDAVNKAMALANPDEVILITGSLYMVAEAREMFLGGKKGG